MQKDKFFGDFLTKIFLFVHSLDLCSSDADEVEIFSLIEEQIPKYKVRACKITNFSGTSNQVSISRTPETIIMSITTNFISFNSLIVYTQRKLSTGL